MIEETLHAANWWVEKIISYKINVEAPSWQSHFEKVMTELLRAKYHNHWYKDDPTRGSGYRAISNEYSLDPILDKAAQAVSHSLPKNLARMVLTSDDRWLVMFVNPGEVTVRDKKFQEIAIYDKHNHIYDKSLKKKSSKWNKLNNKLNKKSAGSSYSKSDDDTLGTLDETQSDKMNETKSDPEDNNNNNNNNNNDNDNGNKGETIDYRQLFLQNIHNAARRNKEKEIEAHVQAFKEEMRLNHRNNGYKFGPYDDEDDTYWRNQDKSNNNSSKTTSPTKSNDNNNNNNNNDKSPKSTKSPKSSIKEKPNIKTSSTNHQILNVLNTLNLSKLHNGLNNNHHNHYINVTNNTFNIDTNHSNYGKHLKSILNSCKIHDRDRDRNKHQIDRNKHKNGTIHHHKKDYVVSMNGEYPILFPMSYASPSPSISPNHSINDHIINNNHDIDIELIKTEPDTLKTSKSQPNIPPFHEPFNHKIQKMKSTGHLFNKQNGIDFELHIDQSSDEDDDVVVDHEEDDCSEIVINTSSPIYGNSKKSSNTISNQ